MLVQMKQEAESNVAYMADMHLEPLATASRSYQAGLKAWALN